jgi:hypothetical protein
VQGATSGEGNDGIGGGVEEVGGPGWGEREDWDSCADEGAGNSVTTEKRWPVCVIVYNGGGGDTCNPHLWLRSFGGRRHKMIIS